MNGYDPDKVIIYHRSPLTMRAERDFQIACFEPGAIYEMHPSDEISFWAPPIVREDDLYRPEWRPRWTS